MIAPFLPSLVTSRDRDERIRNILKKMSSYVTASCYPWPSRPPPLTTKTKTAGSTATAGPTVFRAFPSGRSILVRSWGPGRQSTTLCLRPSLEEAGCCEGPPIWHQGRRWRWWWWWWLRGRRQHQRQPLLPRMRGRPTAGGRSRDESSRFCRSWGHWRIPTCPEAR